MKTRNTWLVRKLTLSFPSKGRRRALKGAALASHKACSSHRPGKTQTFDLGRPAKLHRSECDMGINLR